jgi:hypothetical protein
MIVIKLERFWNRRAQGLPNNQNATQTLGSAPWNNAPSCARKRAHEVDGEPGRGNICCSPGITSGGKLERDELVDYWGALFNCEGRA